MPIDEESERLLAAMTPGGDGPDPALTIAAHDPAWPERAAAELAVIREALGAAALRIEHVGSTSVPGLAAKPIIDIDVTVVDIADEDTYVPQLAALGYGFFPVPAEPEFHFFAKPPERPRSFHVHVAHPGAELEGKAALLRDFLVAHPDEAARYAAVKRAAMDAARGVRIEYMKGKDPYLTDTMRAAEEWARRRRPAAGGSPRPAGGRGGDPATGG